MIRPSATASSGASAGAEATCPAMILPIRVVDGRRRRCRRLHRRRRRPPAEQARDVVGVAFPDRGGTGRRGRARRIAKDRQAAKQRVGMEVFERRDLQRAGGARNRRWEHQHRRQRLDRGVDAVTALRHAHDRPRRQRLARGRVAARPAPREVPEHEEPPRPVGRAATSRFTTLPQLQLEVHDRHPSGSGGNSSTRDVQPAAGPAVWPRSVLSRPRRARSPPPRLRPGLPAVARRSRPPQSGRRPPRG